MIYGLKYSLCFLLVSLFAMSCKSNKETAKTPVAVESAAAADQAEDYIQEPERSAEDPAQVKALMPEYSDSLFLRVARTPCFGQCPTYVMNLYQSGAADLEGKRFFDFIGIFKVTFSEEEMKQIVAKAIELGYFKMNHVYDAPVTDLPSTTVVLQTETQEHWTYDRMNSPDELREFEQYLEKVIKAKAWDEQKPKRQDRD